MVSGENPYKEPTFAIKSIENLEESQQEKIKEKDKHALTAGGPPVNKQNSKEKNKARFHYSVVPVLNLTLMEEFERKGYK